MASPVAFVLFDLGGVLVDPGGVAPMRALSGIDSDEALWARWLACPWVRRFEAGGCSAQEFAAGIVSEWQLDISTDDFLTEFGAWPGDPYPGADELVAEVRATLPTGCLSNINSYQW